MCALFPKSRRLERGHLIGDSLCGQYEIGPDGFTSLHSGDTIVVRPAAKRGVHAASREPIIEVVCELPAFETFAVTFLGTSARLPTSVRNNPGYLIHTGHGFLALDPGEGFTGQLFRKYGHEQAAFVLQALIAVWISHDHVDHYYGVPRLLHARAAVTTVALPVFALPEIGAEFRHSVDGRLARFMDSRPGDVIDLDGITIRNIEVYHSRGAMGCRIEINGGWAIGYSGDRAPYDNFAGEVGQVDLLIHEATYRMDPACGDFGSVHSCRADAIQCGNLIGARYVALTHRAKANGKEDPDEECPVNVAQACDFLACAYEDCGRVWEAIHSRGVFDD
jgi:ribonuclease BN (tRNA processing enzyme)